MPCLVLAALLAASAASAAASPPPHAIAITIDDLPAAPASMGTARERDLTRKLLATLRAHRAPAVGFVIGERLSARGERRPDRAALLEQWLDAGHELGNHGYSHLSANRVPLAAYEVDVVRGDEVLRPLLARRHQTLRWFRHPFLQTGRDLETRARLDAFRQPTSFYDGEPLTPAWVLALAGEEHEFVATDYVRPAAR